MKVSKVERLELWGGTECTLNRVGDRFVSQLESNGHIWRESDLELFAGLGMRTLRFPLLWEQHAPDSLEAIDWSWSDRRLQRLRELGIRPIVGLVHHGSGPRYTSLIDPEFPEKLARFAQLVAERYPWIDAWTPVNEPLTTARFSGLYGHWYPHGRDGATFGRAMLGQCRGVALAMRAVRAVNSAAELIQTDDVGKTFSTEKLRYQADFENERRWLTWDLLSGRVDRNHPMCDYLCWLGLPDRDIAAFSEAPSPPDVIGVNYYVTSERFLDHKLRNYPAETHGSNGRDRYADVAAVRAHAGGITGAKELLREACTRYGTTVAVTEAHLGCTREEQLRWFMEIWRGAENLRTEGYDVRAVTAWSLLGAFDWSSLLTREEGVYEPGAFDLRGAAPRPTAVARMLRALGTEGHFHHPVLAAPGWWHRSMRLLHHSHEHDESSELRDERGPDGPQIYGATIGRRGRPILITGAGGNLGTEFANVAALRGLSISPQSFHDLDITDENAAETTLDEIKPWAVVNCAGSSAVDDAESDPGLCWERNVAGPAVLARVCARRNIPFLTFSSDYVFDGAQRHAYVESDAVVAANAFGASKAAMETAVLEQNSAALVIRSGEVFPRTDGTDFLTAALHEIGQGHRVRVTNEVTQSMAYLPDLVNAALDLLIDGESGIWHLANIGATTPADLVTAAAEIAGLDSGLIERVPNWTLHHAANRPRNRVLESERGQLLPELNSALHRSATAFADRQFIPEPEAAYS